MIQIQTLKKSNQPCQTCPSTHYPPSSHSPLFTLPPSPHTPHSPPLPPLQHSPPLPPKSNLVNFDLFWKDLIQNVTTFYINNFFAEKSNLIKFDPFWTVLIQKNQKQNSHFHPFCKCDKFF